MTDIRHQQVLAELRCARLRARLYVQEIDAIGIALRAGMIDALQALELMADAGTLDFLMPTPPSHNLEYVDTERWPS